MKKSFKEFVVIDLETTGFNPASCDIVELAAVRFVDFKPAETYSTLVKPKNGINYYAMRVNGITERMVENAPYIEEVAGEFYEFVAGSEIIVGQNVQFDLRFLRSNGIHLPEWKYEIHDTMRLAKKHLCRGEVEDHQLETLCDYYGIKNKNAHRSASDCVATGELFIKLVKDMG